MAGRSTPPDPNYKLYGLYGGKDKYLAAKKARDDAKNKATNAKKPYEESNAALDQYLNQPNYGLYRKLNDAKLAHNQTLVDSINAEIRKTRAKISVNSAYIYKLDVDIKNAQDAFEKKKVVTNNTNNGPGDKTEKPGTVYTGAWKFNAPMVNNRSALEKSDLPKMIHAGSDIQGDAKKFWTSDENGGGKGAFQMDRQTNTTEFLAEAKKAADKAGRGKDFDPNYYGFKFHYNPTTVNMSWAGVMGANPVFEAANLDPAIPMAQNLFGANLTFDIILNRIQDLALLNPDGSYKTGSNPYDPVTVSSEDRKNIAEKGTMYDLEYLFHTMHGFMASANYKSTLMYKTNDPGWLPVRPVELHLGKKLRYRVRVLNMEVVHKIFSESMVPILSVVSFNCARYWDGPIAKDPKK